MDIEQNWRGHRYYLNLTLVVTALPYPSCVTPDLCFLSSNIQIRLIIMWRANGMLYFNSLAYSKTSSQCWWEVRLKISDPDKECSNKKQRIKGEFRVELAQQNCFMEALKPGKHGDPSRATWPAKAPLRLEPGACVPSQEVLVDVRLDCTTKGGLRNLGFVLLTMETYQRFPRGDMMNCQSVFDIKSV